jgi:nitric oxide reductase subunit C
MRLNTKRWIIGILVTFFFIYSIVIYTLGTRVDKGAAALTEQSKLGKLVYQKKNCVACHQIYGLGGYMGPDLTNVISSLGKGPDYARVFIKNGTFRMPNNHLTDEEVDQLIAFLTYIDKTGVSPVKHFKIHYDGTVKWKGYDEEGN